MSEALNQRAVMKGVQCVCGQWWPDYVMRGGLAHMECCGSVYEVRPATSGVVLSLRDEAGKMMEGKMISDRDAEGVSHHSTLHDFTKSAVEGGSDGFPVSSSPFLQVPARSAARSDAGGSESEEGGGL